MMKNGYTIGQTVFLMYIHINVYTCVDFTMIAAGTTE